MALTVCQDLTLKATEWSAARKVWPQTGREPGSPFVNAVVEICPCSTWILMGVTFKMPVDMSQTFNKLQLCVN